MGMWTTDNQDTMKIVLKAFNDAAYKRYDNHSYSAGYLESVVVEMLAHTPKRYQKALISSMVGVTQRLEREAIEKMKESADMIEATQKQERVLNERRAAGENGFFVEKIVKDPIG